MGAKKAERLEKARAALRAASLGGRVELDDVPAAALAELGLTRRGLYAFVRANAAALGGTYRANRTLKGDARAFRDTDRRRRDTGIWFIFTQSDEGSKA
jgi:hypothetical protein